MWSAMTDYDKVANDTLSKWNAHMTTQLMPKFGAAIAEALRTAVEKERERLIEALPEEETYDGVKCKLHKDCEAWNAYRAEAIKKLRGKDTPQNG